MKLGTLLRITDMNSVENAFARLRTYGFEACQIVYKPERYDTDDALKIKEAAEQNGIDISAQFCGYYDSATVWDNYEGFRTSGLNVEPYAKQRLDYVLSAAEFAHAAGISDIVIHAGFLPNDPFSEKYALMLSAVKMICDHCKSMGMNLLLETGGESAVAFLRLVNDTESDNLFINMDPANMLMYGYANPIDFLYTAGKYVRNVHGKDGLPPIDPINLGKETKIGEGRVDFYRMFSELKNLGYDRYIIIEREISGDQQIRDILDAKKYFEDLLVNIGY